MKLFNLQRLRTRRRSGGVAIVTAIFLLVVVAGLGVAAVSLTTTQQAGSVQDMQGQRAYQAARAGVEWALYTELRTAAQLGCPATKTFKMPSGTTLSDFTVTVVCTAKVAGIAGNAATDPTAGHFRITATACNQPVAAGTCPNASPGVDYAQRVISVQL